MCICDELHVIHTQCKVFSLFLVCTADEFEQNKVVPTGIFVGPTAVLLSILGNRLLFHIHSSEEMDMNGNKSASTSGNRDRERGRGGTSHMTDLVFEAGAPEANAEDVEDDEYFVEGEPDGADGHLDEDEGVIEVPTPSDEEVVIVSSSETEISVV